MDTPVCDFIREYASSGNVRMHMPGHKGKTLTGPEPFDITEVQGAGELYTGDGPVGRGEENTASLFGTAKTCWSTEGSSQCIRAMLALATGYGAGSRTVIAARNAHRSFLTACALLDLNVIWLWPEEYTLCSCPVGRETVEQAILSAEEKPAAVFLTSPDYLGYIQDVSSIAAVCHAYGIPLLVDNAHGAYLRFLDPSLHPIDQGADLVCDSAHKTLPALTGCAYLHIAESAPENFKKFAKQAMSLFGSTSPSWLLLQSLDAVNAILENTFRTDLLHARERLSALRESLRACGVEDISREPLKLTLDAFSMGCRGDELGEHLRNQGIEPEYVDPRYVVLMPSPWQGEEDYVRLERALAAMPRGQALPGHIMQYTRPEQVLSIRDAMLAASEELPLELAEGRVLSTPTLSCPPAVSVAVSGERITGEAVAIMRFYGMERISVVEETK